MTGYNLAEILRRYFKGIASEEEKDVLMSFLIESKNSEEVQSIMEEIWSEYAVIDPVFNADKSETLFQKILTYKQVNAPSTTARPVHRLLLARRSWLPYAAAVLLFFGIGTYVWNMSNGERTTPMAVNPSLVQNDILPGSDVATLTLSNGRKVELKAAGQQTIADGNLVVVNKNGTLTYGKSDELLYNTMSTPKGGQYRLVLPDGTKVWLNAISSIDYPTSFPGKERVVSVTGEAYFEVAKNSKQPFTIKTFKDDIKVLGTHFNVNAYADEPVSKTTLLEGSVRIGDKVLKPGEAYMNGKVVKTDPGQDLAWKNGVFNFNDQRLEQVMRQLSRWYDIEVMYEKGIPAIEFGGEMSKSLHLSDVLDFLKGSKVKFSIEGKRVIVRQ